MLINGTYATTGTTGTGTTGTGTTTGTTGTTGTGSTSGSSATSTGINGAATLDGTNFITLMLAQLQNQDPTNPVDSNTFLTQLAELSEVQGINSLNTNFSALSSSITGNQALQASSLLGHQVLVASSSAITATAGAAVTGAVSVPQTTSDVQLSISNAAGVLVKTIDLGAQGAGNASFSWDGTSNTGAAAAAGTYTLSASYAGATQGGTAATTYVNGTVESVSIGSSGSSTSSSNSSSNSSSGSSTTGTTTTGMTLNVSGVGSVPFANVLQISN